MILTWHVVIGDALYCITDSSMVVATAVKDESLPSSDGHSQHVVTVLKYRE